MSRPRALAGTGRGYAIATPHVAATEAGVAAFAHGGSAIDAALAAAATLTVVYPHMNHVGGDLFALVAHPDGRVEAINASGAAPRGIDVEALRAAGPRIPPYGPLTIDVPGAVSGWALLAERSRLGLARALEPAIRFAREGVPLAPNVAASLAAGAGRLLEDPGVAGVFARGGRPLAEGELLVQTALAGTLETLAAEGAGALYGGELGERFVAGLRGSGSPMTLEDLVGHRAEALDPLAGGFGDLEVLVVPPNSQGFTLLEILGVVERLGLDPDPDGPDAGVLARVFDLACRDRDAHLADPRHAPVSVEELLGDGNLERIAREARAGAPAPVDAQPTPTGDTIALVTTDAEGHAVSLIQSLFDGFGSGVLEGRTGILCHSRGSAFSLDPASPNVLAGGKRPAHSLMPVLVRRGGRVAAVAGTMGGWAQPQINTHVLLRALAAGASPAETVSAPRWSLGDTFLAPEVRHAELEPGVPEATAARLLAAGFEPRRLAPGDELGHAHLIRVAEDGGFEVATDPRADGEVGAA